MATIVIEGTDGCGKHTQSQMLTQALNNQNKPTFMQSFPNYGSQGAKAVEAMLSGKLGENVNSLDPYQSSIFFSVDRLYTFKTVLEEKLNQGTNLVLDRYVESNLLYQATKIEDETEREKFVNWLYDFEYGTLKLPKPDLIIFLNLPLQFSLKLIQERGRTKDIYEKDENFLMNVYERGLKLAKDKGFVILDCIDFNGNLKTKETIHQEIMQLVNPLL